MTDKTIEVKSTYSESDIQILEGLEPVKLRPGQFTRLDCPLHIVQEALDNAVDEAIGGFASQIQVIYHKDGAITISDNGRGIPVGLHPEKKIPVVQAIFTLLYSGGKFNKASGGSAYSYAGGLHGVGVSVTNALSESLEVEVKREGFKWNIAFSNGFVVKPLEKGDTTNRTGTSLRIKPNPKYFQNPAVPKEELKSLAKTKAVLLPGLKVTFKDEVEGSEDQFLFENGISDYLVSFSGGEQPLVPLINGEGFIDSEDESFSEGEGAQWSLSWYETALDTKSQGSSFVNLIPTPLHGTHVAGLKSALFNSLKTYCENHALIPKGVRLSSEDVFKNVRFILSAKVLDPSFDNQTKDALNTRDAVALIEKVSKPQIDGWLAHNPGNAKIIGDLVVRNASARVKASQKVEKRKSSSVVLLPGKLTDCESEDSAVTEIFLVEGDSAGGSAKMARNKETQAILPMRGKGLNTWEKSSAEAMENSEINDISTAIGVPPHTKNSELDWNKLRYGKICILSDADVDGFHIQTLMLTLFYKHFPLLIEKGHIYVAQTPLYRVDAPSVGKKKQAKKLYAMDDSELVHTVEKLKKDGYGNISVSRFKGLGEMNPPELWETSLNPDTRRLAQVILPPDEEKEAVEKIDMLMSKARSSNRRTWLEANEIEKD